MRNFALFVGQAKILKELDAVRYRKVGHIDNRPAPDPNCKHLLLEPLSFASRAGRDPHELLKLPPPVI